MSRQLAVLGECMVEVKPAQPGARYDGATIGADIRYGGDTLNTSVYLARMGVDVAYVTALGDDPLSDWMLDQWRGEGVACDLVSRVPNAVPGLYLIDIDEAGERSFYYWRDQAPARRLLDNADTASALFARLGSFEWLYLSGITLAIYEEPARQRLYQFLEKYREGGGRVCFDNNYRPRQWRNVGQARTAFEQLYRRCDTALPTVDDEQLLFPGASDHDIAERIQGYGVKELVIKLGAAGCRVLADGIDERIAAPAIARVVDSTAAGDSFNAGYLAARFEGLDCREAAQHGNSLASCVVQYPGAIIPRDKMPS